MKYLFLALFFLPGWVNAQSTTPSVVQPAISPDGKTIAFSYQGDIWTMPADGGTPRRLTIHEAYDGNPIFSPDQSSLAFTSERFGNDDIFTLPVDGGMPTRLTYHSGGDQVWDWNSQGNLLFSTRRNYRQIEWDSEIHTVSEKGGTPVRMLDALGDMPSTSPNGRFIAFVKGSCRIDREGYRGPANKDLWLFDTKTKAYKQLTTFQGNEFMPRWSDNETLFFISPETGKYNVHEMKLSKEGKVLANKAITTYKDYGIFYLDASSSGKVVFERMGRLYTVISGEKPSLIPFTMGTDFRFDPIQYETYTSDIESYAVSPNGKFVAFEIHGEIFLKRNDKDQKRTVNISNHPYRDRNPTWLNDSTLLFLSDRSGNYQIYASMSSDKETTDLFNTLKRETKQLTKRKEPVLTITLSPDGEKLAYEVGFGTLKVAKVDEKGKLSDVTTLLDGWDSPSGLAWSPDSKWLAYGLSDLEFNGEVFIHAADGSQAPVNISMHPKNDGQPVWSKDGKKLGFISERNNSDYDIWFVWLTEEDWLKTKRDWEEEELDKKEKKEGDKTVTVTIDLKNIHERLVQVTDGAGDEMNLAIGPKSEFFYYTAPSSTKSGNDLFKVKWDGSDKKEVVSGGASPNAVRLGSDDKLYYLQRGAFKQLDPKSDKTEGMSFTAKMGIDHAQERAQMFDEAWELLMHRFYDPNFHGQDFEALKKAYRPVALHASTKPDFRYFFNLMLGQLNASHMGMYGGDLAETQRERTGLLGIEIRPVKKGIEVVRVIPGTPADRPQSKLEKGDVIVSVNGAKLGTSENFYAHFLNSSDERVLLEVERGKKKHEVIIRPTNSISDELYEEWIDEKRALTEEYSKGALGYIHIRGMNWPSFERFERELTAAGYGKKGLVIDVRFNGGGWTTDYLMTVLNVRQHAYTIPRGAANSLEKEHTQFTGYYPYGERLPYAAWTKPAVALCNASSYSNAEIFSHAFKTLGRGKLVGIPTFGAVISTGGARLLDGSLIRLPFRAWYVKATNENMELGPAVPDIEVENPVDYRANGDDRQLKVAVEEVLKEVK